MNLSNISDNIIIHEALKRLIKMAINEIVKGLCDSCFNQNTTQSENSAFSPSKFKLINGGLNE